MCLPVQMTSLINNPADVVPELLEGVALTQPGLALLKDRTIAVHAATAHAIAQGRRDQVPVAIISGGGAGHEPAHAGYVADGMLTAAIAGGIFASPSVDAILDGIRAVTGEAGALLVVKNYTGDRLNFGMAAEVARSEGLKIEVVTVADDVALATSADNAGRRGLAGTVLVHKIAGALAAAGAPLNEVAATARRVAESVGTMGVALTGATVPGATDAGFDLPTGEVELGLGIHGEPGVSREKLTNADELVKTLVTRIAADRGYAPGQKVVALIGSAGATSALELDIATRAAAKAINNLDLDLTRIWAGPVMTSINMIGISVTLLAIDEELLTHLDAPTTSIAWPGAGPHNARITWIEAPEDPTSDHCENNTDERIHNAIDTACAMLLDNREKLDHADRNVGDGDLGSTLARGAAAWQKNPGKGSGADQLRRLCHIARRDVGGTSGPLYAIMFLRAAEALDQGTPWPEAFSAGVHAMCELGGAKLGDGTMVDALLPAATAACEKRTWNDVVNAAEEGAASTEEGVSRKGRASYVGERGRGYTDPGAVAVAMWLASLRDSLS
ncbi:Dihydroxyacetone kinase [Dermatophilus congolensis]|uniref:Dihydroxyacetone kinase n=2 Tax=Dermatophilus congolensis TaxID=1863 RepID=A0AA46BQ62_9MICO|nr:Dihydroxyacetone kinase [Dermatophilus congolensis]